MKTSEMTLTARLHEWETISIEAAIEWTKERYNNYRTQKDKKQQTVEVYGFNKKF